jgi:hypothetical protein
MPSQTYSWTGCLNVGDIDLDVVVEYEWVPGEPMVRGRTVEESCPGSPPKVEIYSITALSIREPAATPVAVPLSPDVLSHGELDDLIEQIMEEHEDED